MERAELVGDGASEFVGVEFEPRQLGEVAEAAGDRPREVVVGEHEVYELA